MPHEQVTISTRDGSCPAHVFTPRDEQGGPAIIFYMDGGGIRPAALQMAQRLADAGYVVLLPDLTAPSCRQRCSRVTCGRSWAR
jgi:carboxymethylenebutenolidase